MIKQYGYHGFTLVEMIIIVAIIGLLVSIAVPLFLSLENSFTSKDQTKSMIASAMNAAQAIAAKEHRYAGIRFQKAYNPQAPDDPFASEQYIIFIIHDPDIHTIIPHNLACCAYRGQKPLKLPGNFEATDMLLGALSDELIDNDAKIINMGSIAIHDLTTFSILFSPSGRLVQHIHKVQKSIDEDDIFNTVEYIKAKNAKTMFIEDEDLNSIQPTNELSRRRLVIYDKKKFRRAYEQGKPYSDCLADLKMKYINIYMGTFIE